MNEYWFVHEPKPKWVRELQEQRILTGPEYAAVTVIYTFYTGEHKDYLYDGDALVKTTEGIIAPISYKWIDRAKRKNPNMKLHSPVEGQMEEILASIYSDLGKNE